VVGWSPVASSVHDLIPRHRMRLAVSTLVPTLAPLRVSAAGGWNGRGAPAAPWRASRP
jgi:hypothetical protein